MAVESRIDADEEWFVGEDRVLRFHFREGDTEGIAGWTMTFELYERRAKPTDPAVATAAAVGVAATADEPARAVVQINGDATTTLGAGVYQFVLRRTDVGARSILAFGPVELLSPRNA